MAHYFFEGQTPNGEKLILSPLPDRILAISDQEIADTAGHFLYLKPDSDDHNITILAQIFSDEAVLEISRMLNLR